MGLYAYMLRDEADVRADVLRELSSQRLLTMSWLDGRPLLEFERADRGAQPASPTTCSAPGTCRSTTP